MTESCWCGLPREMHDGREMDREGNMHLFGRPVREEAPKTTDEEAEPVAAKSPAPAASLPAPPSLGQPDAELLKEVKRFLDIRIVQPSQNGVKKLPLLVVNEATRLSRALDRRIDRLLFLKKPGEGPE